MPKSMDRMLAYVIFSFSEPVLCAFYSKVVGLVSSFKDNEGIRSTAQVTRISSMESER